MSASPECEVSFDSESDTDYNCRFCVDVEKEQTSRPLYKKPEPRLVDRLERGYAVYAVVAKNKADIMSLISRMGDCNDYYPMDIFFGFQESVCYFQTPSDRPFKHIQKFISKQRNSKTMLETLGWVIGDSS